MTDLARAAQLLEQGDWRGAHEIVQDDESPLACWAHGIVHTMEGDLANADYWYRRADRARPGPEHTGAEIAALQARLRGIC